MSDFSQDIDALISGVSEPARCPVARLLKKIESDHGKDVADKFANVANDQNYSAAKIIGIATKHGYKIGRDSIHRHRRKGMADGCVCQS